MDDLWALRILRSCRRAIASSRGRLQLFESALIQHGETLGPLLDLVMLVMVGGKGRTVGELRSLLAEAGFALTTIRATRSRVSLVEAEPVPDGRAG